MDNINTSNVINNATLGNLFRECGAGGDATIPGAAFMNQVMLELLMPVLNTCQTKSALDLNDPDSYSQLWNAIQTGGGSCGFSDWSNGTTETFVKGADCQFYYANPSGTPSTTNPVGDDGSSWNGPHCSAPAMIAAKLSECTVIDTASDQCGTLYDVKYVVDDATGCGSFVKTTDTSLDVTVTVSDKVVQNLPADPDDRATYYNRPDLGDDREAGTIDQARLDSTKIMCASFDVPCDATYAIRVEGIAIDNLTGTLGVSTLGFTEDGNWLFSGNSILSATEKFTSYQGGYTANFERTYTPGNHVLCFYLLGFSPNAESAVVNITSNAPRVYVTRK